MNPFVECQFTFEDLRDCALLLDDKNPKLCEIYELVVIVVWHFSSLTHFNLYVQPGLHKKR